MSSTPSLQVKSNIRTLLPAIFGFTGHQLCEAAVPFVVGIVIDRAIGPSEMPGLVTGIGALVAVFLLLIFSWRTAEIAATNMFADMDYRTRRSLLERVLAPLRAVRSANRSARSSRPGETLSTVTTDVGTDSSIAWVIGGTVAYLVVVALTAVGLLLINVPLGLAVLVLVPVLVFVAHKVSAPLEKRSGAEQQALADSSATVTDILSGLRTVRGLGVADEAARRAQRANLTNLTASIRAARAEGALTGVATVLTGLFLAALVFLSSRAVLDGSITIGQLVTVIGVAQFLQGPVGALAQTGPVLARIRASRGRVGKLMDTDTGEFTPEKPPVSVAAGEILGIVTGEREAKEISERFADSATSVPHNASLLDGSISDNIWPATGPRGDDGGLGSAGTADLIEAAALADLLGPDGWNRRVGERGRLLSGGQRQRVILARALAEDPEVLVLHEPTSSVDSVTETKIARGLADMRAGRPDRATVLITRSPVLLGVCTRVEYLDEVMS